MHLNGMFTEELLNAFIEGIEEGCILLDENLDIKYVNRVIERIVELKSSEITGKSIDFLFKVRTSNDLYNVSSHSTFKEIIDKDQSSCVLSGKGIEGLYVETRIKKLSSSPAKGYLLFLKNPEEKIQVNRIKESEKKYKGLFDNAIEGILIVDNEGKIVDANPAACKIYRFKKEQMLKMFVKDIFPHKSAEEADLIWKEFLRNGYLDGFYKYKLNNDDVRYLDFKVRANFIEGMHLAVFSDVTEKTEIAKALRISEANLKAIFNNTNQEFVLLDTNFKIVTFNEGAQRNTLKYQGKELRVGESIFTYGREGDEEKFQYTYERLKNGETIFTEINPNYKNYSESWIEVGFIPVFDNKKILKGILISSSDITFRKKAEIALAESEARFRSLVQNSSDIITILDDEYRIKYTSASIEKILGYKEGELLDKDLLNYIHEDERNNVISNLNKICRGEHFNPILEYRFLHADEYYLHLETTCSNLISNEHVKGIVLNTRDITERKYQEENLLLLERAVDSSSNGIIISDPNQPDNPIIYANKAFEQITGYNYLDIIGKNCRYLQQNDRDQPGIEKVRKAISSHKEVNAILRNYKKDGQLFWNDLSLSPVFNRSGEISNFIGVINDITERKVADDALLEISQGISSSDNYDIYASLAMHLGIRLQTDIALVGETIGDKIITKAIWQEGEFQPYLEFPLKDSACASVIEKGICVTIENVESTYPGDFIVNKEKMRSFMGVPLKDSNGKTIGVLVLLSKGAFQNVPLAESVLNIFSVRASAELERDYYIAALKSSEEKFKELAKNSPDIIYIIDVNLKKVIYFNREDILGYNNQELSLSEGWNRIVHPDDVQRVIEHWQKFILEANNNTKSIEYRIQNRQGVYEWVTNRHIVIERNGDGSPKHVLLNLTVITERKKAEDALRESEARLKALIENTNDVMWSVDTTLSFTTMNSAFKNLFKLHFDKDIKVGDNLYHALPDMLKDEWLDYHARTLKGEIFSVEFVLSDKAKDLSYEVSYNPIYSDEGTISGVSVFARDITQRKLVENDIIRTNFELDSFVYRASHDLRAPLRSVLGLISLAKTENDEKERNTYLHLVEKSVNKLDTFISDLTNFSRNSRLEVTITKIEFRAIIEECLENLKYMDNADRIDTIININNDSEFYSDFTRINIILQNIISNAIKYQNLRNEESYVKIDIYVQNEYSEIKITDNGKGIKDEYLDKIFNMFFRASQESYGSGLGLYITKQVVEKLQGSIEVTSKLGSGTEFRIKLPNLRK